MGDPIPRPINTALVRIYCDNVLTDTLVSDGFGKYVSTWLYPEKGKLYTVEVNAEGYPTAKASDRIPSSKNTLVSAVAVDKPIYDAISMVNVYRLYLELNDNGNSIDFYDLNLYKFGGHMYDAYKHYYDPVVQAEGMIEHHAPTIFFSDHLFNGKQQSLSFLITYIPEGNSNLPLILQKISEHYYRYLRGLTLQNYFKLDDEGSGDASGLDILFLPGEAYKIHTNVENGYGIVAGFATESKEIEKRVEK